MKYSFSIQVYDINNNLIVKVNIFLQYKFKILRDFAFNLAVVTEFVNYFNRLMFNIMFGSSQ